MQHRNLESHADSFDLDIFQIFYEIWNAKLWIILGTLFFTIIGLTYALISPPQYYSEATIALRETGKEADASRIFSQFGSIGGLAASTLGIGSINLYKLEILLSGRELAEKVIEKNNLLPQLFSRNWKRENSKLSFNDSLNIPTLRDGVEYLRNNCLTISPDAKKNIIIISIKLNDPQLAKSILDYYLIEANRKIRLDVISEAKSNRKYLENQYNTTIDPILREKISHLIGVEIEKSMLVSSSVLQILEAPEIPIFSMYPKKKLIVTISFFAGLSISIFLMLLIKGLSRYRKSRTFF